MLTSEGTIDFADAQRLAAKLEAQSSLLGDAESVNWQLGQAIAELTSG